MFIYPHVSAGLWFLLCLNLLCPVASAQSGSPSDIIIMTQSRNPCSHFRFSVNWKPKQVSVSTLVMRNGNPFELLFVYFRNSSD